MGVYMKILKIGIFILALGVFRLELFSMENFKMEDSEFKKDFSKNTDSENVKVKTNNYENKSDKKNPKKVNFGSIDVEEIEFGIDEKIISEIVSRHNDAISRYKQKSQLDLNTSFYDLEFSEDDLDECNVDECNVDECSLDECNLDECSLDECNLDDDVQNNVSLYEVTSAMKKKKFYYIFESMAI